MSPCVYAPLDTRRPHGDSHSLLLQTNGAGAHSQLGRESIKNFDSCCLCLQPVIEPMSWCALLAAHFASMQPHILLSRPTLGAVQPQGPHFLQRVHLPEFADAKTAHRSRPQVVREGAREQKGAHYFRGATGLLTGGRERMQFLPRPQKNEERTKELLKQAELEVCHRAAHACRACRAFGRGSQTLDEQHAPIRAARGHSNASSQRVALNAPSSAAAGRRTAIAVVRSLLPTMVGPQWCRSLVPVAAAWCAGIQPVGVRRADGGPDDFPRATLAEVVG